VQNRVPGIKFRGKWKAAPWRVVDLTNESAFLSLEHRQRTRKSWEKSDPCNYNKMKKGKAEKQRKMRARVNGASILRQNA